MVPHLVTALNGPIGALERRFLDAAPQIEHWLTQQWRSHAPPIHASVDVRHAGFKVAPVDTNLYPGGWNNLTAAMLPLAAQAARDAIERLRPGARRLLLVPENHTRNLFYLANVARLQAIFRQAGLSVRLGTVNPDIQAPTTFELPDGGRITLEPLVRRGGRLGLDGFEPCVVLLNNDLSAGVPAVLDGLDGPCLVPPLHAGWHVRRKSRHFEAYDAVAHRLSQLIDIDPWLLNPLFDRCSNVRFADGTGLDRLQEQVDALLGRIRRRYAEHGIDAAPFVIVKADNGTYGMGIMTVRDAAELAALNRRTRNKMDVIKDGQQVSDVLIQEGVPTVERIGGAVAEPVVYLMDRQVVGGFYRVNAGRGIDENLNAPGARFEPLAFEPDAGAPNRYYMHGVIGRLASLAAAHELENAASERVQPLLCA